MRTHQIPTIVVLTALVVIVSLLNSCSDLKSVQDLPMASTGTLQIHDAGWSDTTASNFHGTVLKQSQYNLTECATCHSSQFTGGTSGVACAKCHQYYPHPAGFGSSTVHPLFLYNQNYPMSQCKACHGATYAGGRDANLSCVKSGCHVDANNAAKSPESCSTCHGNFKATTNDLVSAAPPKTVLGVSDPAARGVGAHQKHLATGLLGKTLKCQECHTVPSQLTSAGHLGTLPAEVVFNDTLSQLKSGNGSLIPKPSYDPTTLKCSNTFCHGDWKIRKATSSSQFIYTDSVMVGENYSPVWTGGSTAAACGTCHGIPPKGHLVLAVSSCGTCHIGVVDNNGQIVDKTKHMNGKINVFGQEYAF
ncbi:MAG: CxxxxCH/CxxCH domain-containing protein [Bacteroidota bacterium]|jgi:predicted CxxxxCH...CXXCH cytochrome family protein